jgi:glycosyltransferase involved in cell wall biosynthesis
LEGNPKLCYHRAAVEESFDPYFEAIVRGGSGDILNLLFPIPHSFLRIIYAASDVVLANSTFEPFGLVGLEAMATGAIVFTGCSGEDYATHLYNAIVLDTFQAGEIQFYTDYLRIHPDKKEAISTAARRTAEQWTWEEVIKRLVSKLEYQARLQGIA